MTVTKIAINGFGRIGRLVLRALYESGRDDIEVTAQQNQLIVSGRRADAEDRQYIGCPLQQVANAGGITLIDSVGDQQSAPLVGPCLAVMRHRGWSGLEAEDRAENRSTMVVPFTIDRTAPEVAITSPAAGSLFGPVDLEIAIEGLGGVMELSDYDEGLRLSVALAPVTGVDVANRRLLLENGYVHYDYLILAQGAVLLWPVPGAASARWRASGSQASIARSRSEVREG